MFEGPPRNFHSAPTDNISNQSVEKLTRVSNDAEFQRLLSGYVEYISSEKIAAQPMAHGTGSAALKNILREGFQPRTASDTGESVFHKSEKEAGKPNPVSFAVGDDKGQKISHWYATLPCHENALAFNSESVLGSRIDRIINEVYGGWEQGLAREMGKIDTSGFSAEQLVETKQEVEIRMRHKYEDRARQAANVFDPEFARKRIDGAQLLLEGKVEPAQAKQILLDLDLLDGWVSGNGKKIYETDHLVMQMIVEAQEDGSRLRNSIEKKITSVQIKMQEYEAKSDPEKQELTHQFPCYVMIEGQGQNLTLSPWMPGEMHSFETVPPTAIREIQVPESKISEVQQWVTDAGLGNVRVVPFEYFEMKEVIEKAS